MSTNTSFGQLFKRYRLKSQFETLSDFGAAMAETGLIYEDSIFYKWQKGIRVPQDRKILIKLLNAFVERKAITTLNEANEFLESAGQGYLTEDEIESLPLQLDSPPFQVPNEVADFSIRQGLIDELMNQNLKGKIVFIHGLAGVGKTALAIKLGHLLKKSYSDGVLWYKVEEDNMMDILFSIARLFGEDIHEIHSKEVRATVVRSLLNSKRVLIFFDSGEICDDIHLLFPSSETCTVVVTSQSDQLKSPLPVVNVEVKPFTDQEVIQFFKDILKNRFPEDDESIIKIAKRVGNLPLALHIIARQLEQNKDYLLQLPHLLEEENSFFLNLYHKEKNLYAAIALGYEKLDPQSRSILISASIFKGRDFSDKSIAYINGLSISSTGKVLGHLSDLSLIEKSTKNRFRMHPAIQQYVRDKLNYPKSSFLITGATFIFAAFTLIWIYLQFIGLKNIFLGNLFGVTYFLMALYGGIFGVHTSIKWGGLKSLLGKSIAMFSIGLFMQVVGQISYSYVLLFKHTTALYPSFGDIAYFGTIPFYIYATWLLAESSGIKVNLQVLRKKIIAIIIPVIALLIAYLLFLRDYNFDWHNPIKVFLDFGYPGGEAIYISIAIVIFIFSRNILDGIMRSRAFLILIALVAQFITDYLFLYTSNIYVPGNIIDFLCLLAYYLMALALLNFKSIRLKTLI